MRRLVIAAGGLVLLALAGLWVGPLLVNWEAWRGQLAAVASDRLGRPVTLDGPMELTLLPHPVVRAGGVTIADAPGEGEGFGVTARLLRVRLDLSSLLAGRIEPRELTLVGAELTLPWPPGPILTFRAPTWITQLDARVEESRVRLGEATLEGVTATLTSAGPAQPIEIAGSFAWAGRAARFAASLGRPGWDGIAPVEISLNLPEANGQARGVLVPGGGFEGMVEAAGPDLAALLPSAPGAFRAGGRLTATADLIAAEELTLDLGGAPARGSLALRLSPAPRLDIALIVSRLDLDGWVAALRGGSRGWPVSLDVAAEAAVFSGVTLRRLRGIAMLEDGRLTLTDVSLLLPGETEVDLAGTTAGGRLEIGARFAGPDIRASLDALGLPVEGLDPALLRRGEGRFRLVLEETQAALQDFAASFEGLRVSGAGTLRHGPRPALGVGLSVDRLDLARWMPRGLDLNAAARALGPVDLNLRLAAESASWGGAVLERATLDAAVEAGRVTLRRLSGRLAEADIAVSGTATLGAQMRLGDVTVEASGSSARGLFALAPGGWPDSAPIAAMPVALRLSGGGPPEALALRGSAELGELRAEANGTLDLVATRGGAAVTLRHPGAPRLLSEAFGMEVGPWLGEGSFSLIAQVTAGPGGVAAESFELVAAGLRAGGALALAAGPRPRVTGRVTAERLPLPVPALRGTEPLGLEALAGFDAEVTLEAGRIELDEAVLEAASAGLRLADARLAVERLRARIAGGTLEGTLGLDVANGPPRATAELRVAEATIAAPVFGLPYDLAAGRGEASASVAATGHAPAALLGTLSGGWRVALRDGVLTGFDLGATAAGAALPDLAEAEAAARRGLAGGATAFDRLEAEGRIEAGRLRIESGRVTTEAGATAALSGGADLARGTVGLRFGVRPAAEGPEIGLGLSGPAEAPRPLPEVSDWARWRAERS